MPADIDLIETLFTCGEMSIQMLYRLVPNPQCAWRMLSMRLTERSIALWVNDAAAGTRRRAQWEVDAILRNRIDGSGEPTPPDDDLVIRATDRTDGAYYRDFGAWCERG